MPSDVLVSPVLSFWFQNLSTNRSNADVVHEPLRHFCRRQEGVCMNLRKPYSMLRAATDRATEATECTEEFSKRRRRRSRYSQGKSGTRFPRGHYDIPLAPPAHSTLSGPGPLVHLARSLVPLCWTLTGTALCRVTRPLNEQVLGATWPRWKLSLL